MQLELKHEILAEMLKKYPDNIVFEPSESRWGSTKTVESKFISKDELATLVEIYARDENKENREDRRQGRNIRSLEKLYSGKANKIINLKQMTEAIILIVLELPHHWVFVEDEVAEVMVPYFVTNVRYRPARDMCPASIELTGLGMYRGEQRKLSKYIYRDDLVRLNYKWWKSSKERHLGWSRPEDAFIDDFDRLGLEWLK